MKLIVIVLALAVDRFSELHVHLHKDAWFAAWSRWMRGRGMAPAWHLALVVSLPALVVYGIDRLVATQFLGLFSILFGAAVLFYSLGRGPVDQRLSGYLADWLRGDHQAAWYTLADWIEGEEAAPDTALQLHEAVRAAYVGRMFYGLFVPVFWYLLLGPAGAIICLFLQLAIREPQAGSEERAMAARFRELIGVLPARVFAGTCALVGSYGGAARVLLDEAGNWRLPAAGTVERAALAALEGAPPLAKQHTPALASISGEAVAEFQALQELFNRCLVLMLVVIAVAVIFGWG